VSLPVLTPEQHTKALWIVGVGLVAVVTGLVMELAAPPTLEEGDVKAAKQEAKRRGRTVKWETLDKLKAIKRVGDRMTRTYRKV
jgi:hypothetical protein